MAAEDARREAWLGALPTVLTLAPDEVATLKKPKPYCLCLPRQSLLPLAADRIRAHFEAFVPPMAGDALWFEYDGTPLRWQLPIGVLYDLLCGEESQTRQDLPWRITVHFASFPANELLRATVREAESVLLNGLKEACFLRCGSATPAMDLTPAAQLDLLTALADTAEPAAAYAKYAAVAGQVEDKVQAQVAKMRQGPPRGLPLRACISPTEWRQQPVSPTTSSGEPATLGDGLAILLPALYPHGTPKHAASVVLVQGVRVALSTPLVWLWEACSHPDGWLYAIIKLPPSGVSAAAPDMEPIVDASDLGDAEGSSSS